MRKSVMFFIGVLFVISVVVVSFFGMQARLDQFKKYISEIEITSYDQIVGNRKYLVVEFIGEQDTFTTIRYRVAPTDDSITSSVEFLISDNTYTDEDGEKKEFASIDKNTGILEFYRYFEDNHFVTITIRSTDGSNVSDSVSVLLYLPAE